MKLSRVSLPVLVLLAFCTAYGQEIPKGVNYKKASEEVNALAKTNLEKALAGSDSLPPELFGEVVVVGPMLWKALKPSAEKALIDAKRVLVIVPGPVTVQGEGRKILTDDERKAFWKVFRARFSKLKDAKVRKANPEEISFYWAEIPFDIEEPFWVVDVDGDRFVLDFEIKEGQPRLFWIDLVGDFGSLKP